MLQSGVTYRPSKDYAVLVPTYILSLFISVPLLYAGINVLYSARCDSIDTLWDGHSRPEVKIPTASTKRHNDVAKSSTAWRRLIAVTDKTAQDESSVPEICDIDVGIINRMLLREERRRQKQRRQWDDGGATMDGSVMKSEGRSSS
eukprot:CAMPEP_0197446898 /NCGR_PEP_ID=MMETSP1175-20131217/11711_1 /TAXON_ID=1003142 /ORGANISM="Triceratium dubium, Strain CCMP147" /LENGTH=145 /DNA_ID=CAMNT_0042978069 /DNA_START=36 /DNA_END=473 /DNA_ORIENTATION=+